MTPNWLIKPWTLLAGVELTHAKGCLRALYLVMVSTDFKTVAVHSFAIELSGAVDDRTFRFLLFSPNSDWSECVIRIGFTQSIQNKSQIEINKVII